MKNVKLIWLLFLLPAFHSCQQSEENISPFQEISIEKINISEDLFLQNLLNENIGKISNGRTLESSIGNIELNEAIRVDNPELNTIRYSLLLNSNADSYNFDNYIIKERDGEVYQYIISYSPDTNWLIEHYPDLPWSSFTGGITAYLLDGTIITEDYLINGISQNVSEKDGRIEDCYECSFEVRESSATGNEYLEVSCGGGGDYIIFRTECGGGGSGGGGTSGGSGGSGSGTGGSGGGSSGSGTGGSGGGSSGGGGTSSGSGTGNDVVDFDPNDCIDDDCPTDPIGILPPEDDITNIIAALALGNLLNDDPFALINIDCDQIENWQALAQHTPPQGVLDKLKNLDDNYTSILAGDWDVQYIEDASGPIVNMDYFPVTITQLPNNPSTGQTFTPEGFFNHVRTNLNDFFEDNSTEFGPYNPTEAAIWNSSDYLGAIMRFDINTLLFDIIPGQQDGSVICANKESTSWTFTTIESPIDWNHPVSGNREFGLEDNGDGTFTFYTRGVDRVAENFDDFAGNLPDTQSAFEGGDALWSKLQENLENYINDPINGGVAQKQTPQVERPNWDDVKDVLNGDKPISDLGCN